MESNVKIIDIQGILSPNAGLLPSIYNKESNDEIFNSEALKYIL